jgi:hypothetical protein
MASAQSGGGLVAAIVDYFPDGMGEFFHAKGFLDESVASPSDNGSGVTHAVAAGQQHLDVRPDPCAAGQRPHRRRCPA